MIRDKALSCRASGVARICKTLENRASTCAHISSVMRRTYVIIVCVCVCVYTVYVDGDGISRGWIVRDERKSKGRVESKGSERKRYAVSWWLLESSGWIGGEKYSLIVYSLLTFANSEQWRSLKWFGRHERGISVRNLKKRALVNTRA